MSDMFKDPEYPSMVMGYGVVMTSPSFPEQYNITFKEEIVGYLRERHGFFCAFSPNHGGDIVYETMSEDDGGLSDLERPEKIEIGVILIDRWRRVRGLPCPSSGHDAMRFESIIKNLKGVLSDCPSSVAQAAAFLVLDEIRKNGDAPGSFHESRCESI